MKKCFAASVIAGLLASNSIAIADKIEDDERPNIVVILADDLGYSDIGSYGSEINTPNIDQLAAEGLRFSNYRSSASCAPSRAMLLTGVDSHRAGVANIPEALTPEQARSPFYNGSLNHNVVTIATLLMKAGYHTNMVGKWHLGYNNNSLKPINRGFEQTLMMPFSGGDNWTNQSYLPHYEKTLWFKNGKEIPLPGDFYSSKFIVDNVIKQLENNRNNTASDKPFFTYVSFLAVHIPVQAPKEYTDKYIETYSDGWTALRKRRQQAVKELGLVRADTPMKKMNSTEDWGKLSAEQKRYHTKSMAVYAGMIDAMDFHIGRLINYLKEIDEYDNTVFIFTSDNGAEPSDPGRISKAFPLTRSFLGYNADYETLGEKYSYNFIGRNFASAASSPFGHYKFHSGEGGLRVPMIISGPALSEELQGQINHGKAYVKDLAPTILSLAGTEHPGTEYQGNTIEPSTGINLHPVINGQEETVYDIKDIIAYEIGGNAALIKGDYKIILNRGKYDDGQWHLYNVTLDPGETTELDKIQPAIFSDLLNEYESYAKSNGVIPVPKKYIQTRQIAINGLKAIFSAEIVLFAIGLISLIAFIIYWRRKTT